MNVSILIFGIIKDIVGKNRLAIEIENDSTVSTLKNRLLDEYPELSKYKNYSVAVNEQYVEDNYHLSNNDVIALIPPVSGG
ncbi:MAG: MoaD/ThiS family protein [Aureibaculum sp.]